MVFDNGVAMHVYKLTEHIIYNLADDFFNKTLAVHLKYRYINLSVSYTL